jgi:hypothetical protein
VMTMVDFVEKLANIRLDLFVFYTEMYKTLDQALTTKIKADLRAFKVLGQLVDQRNAGGQSLANEDYFKFDNLRTIDVAAFVLEGSLDEVNWLERAERPEDIESRLHWVCEQEQALLEMDQKDVRVDRKLCALKGRFLVLWTALLRLGLFKQDADE